MQHPTKFRLSALAKNDILKIFEFTIQNWGEVKAKEYAQKLSDCFDFLANSPQVGKSRNELYPQIQSFPVGSHVIFYIINRELDTNIEISRILHQHMDFENQF